MFSRACHIQVSCIYGYGYMSKLKSPQHRNVEFYQQYCPSTLPSTLFSSPLFQRQAWPELCAKPEDSGQTQPGSNCWRTTGAPSKCHSCLKLADSFPQLVLPTHGQWKDQMCLYTWIKKNMHDVLSVYDKINLNVTVYMAQMSVWPLHCQSICVFSCSILCGHGTWRSQHLLPNPD